jgi:trigger factor
MKLVESKTENRTTTIKVELDAEELAKASEETYKRLNKDIIVPGFRKGKAPKQLLINHVGQDAFNTEVYEDYVPIACEKIITDEKIEMYARPYIHVIGEDPVTFEAVIPLTPIVDLCDYKAVRIDYKEAEVKDEDVNSIIDRFRKQNATWTESEGPVENSDIVTVDLDSHSGDEPFIQQKGMPFQVTVGSEYPVKGFSEEVIGMKKDDVKEFELDFFEPSLDVKPTEDGKGVEDVKEEEDKKRSRRIAFKFTVNEIRKEQMAELTDDFAKSIIPTCKDVAGLKKIVYDELKHREEDNIRSGYTETVLEKIVEGSKIEYPDYLVERELDVMVDEYYERVKNSVNSQEEFDSIIKGTNIEDLRKSYKPSAETRVKNNLVVSKVMDLENIDTTEEEIDAQLKLFVSDAPDPEKRMNALNTPENRRNIKNWNTSNKTLKFLVECGSSDWTEEQKATLVHSHNHDHDHEHEEEAAEESAE